MLWKKKNDTDKNSLSSDEYVKCITKLAEFSAELKSLALDVKLLKTDLDNLRGNFGRKLRGLKTQEEENKEAEKIDEPKTINTNEYVAFG